jgi:hypothetical protein
MVIGRENRQRLLVRELPSKEQLVEIGRYINWSSAMR